MMALSVSHDSNGLARVDFSTMREKLLEEDGVFDAQTLRFIPYEQLNLCCIANAGAARCSVTLVRAEKQNRRRRFVEMSPDRLRDVRRYIQVEGMYPDIERIVKLREAVRWDQLSVLQKIWYKLTCVHNHVDAPAARLRDAKNLFHRAAEQGSMPPFSAVKYIDLIVALIECSDASYSPGDYGMLAAGYAEEILQRMPTNERRSCAKDLVIDYQCTSDCFQPPVNNES